MLISLDSLYDKYNLEVTGVLHVGAHLAEEASAYARYGIENVVWVEANHDLIPRLTDALRRYPRHRTVLAAVSDKDGEIVTFHVTSDPEGTAMSSSILELEVHKIHAPWVKEVSQKQLVTRTIDTLCDEYAIENCNFLNLDIQGAELLALQGAETFLETCDYIYTEVNTNYLYKDCALLGEIDEWLGERGYERFELSMTSAEWGDAFYMYTGDD